MEQTFHDLCYENQQAKKSFFRFVLWMFVETALGIFREHLLLVNEGDSMQTIRRTLGPSTGISFLIILPFIAMEIVNRRTYNEDFPFMLFFVLWLNLFAIGIILLPVMLARRSVSLDLADSFPAQGNTLLTSPRSAAIISIILVLSPILLSWLNSLGWVPVDRLFNGPNPEQPYIPGQILSLLLISIPIAGGIIAGGPIVRTLRSGGSLFAYPIHLIIIVVISFLFAVGVVGLVADQWPCFMGVPYCD